MLYTIGKVLKNEAEIRENKYIHVYLYMCGTENPFWALFSSLFGRFTCVINSNKLPKNLETI